MHDPKRGASRTWAVPLLLLASAGIALIWEVSARYSARPFAPFTLTPASFAGFEPEVDGWELKAVPVSAYGPEEPNILAFEAARGERRALVRLVHGYNMPMCLKIKEYDVALSKDRVPLPAPGVPCQVWRVTSSVGDTSVWISSLLRAGDFAPTADDVRSLPFPRVGTPDDPRWKPEGLTWKSLRHPLAELRVQLRARWNSSRTDVLTFLRLRQPAWASEELLTLVSRTLTPPGGAARGKDWTDDLESLHAGFARSLRRWKEARGTAGDAPVP